jgi:hypothetical protein
MAAEGLPAFYIPDLSEAASVNGVVMQNDDGTATFRSEHYTIDIPKLSVQALRATGQCVRPAIVLKKRGQT